MSFQDNIPSIPFRKWLWKDKENRLLLCISGIAILVLLTWHKHLYYYPNFIPDSHAYLATAFNNQDVDARPIGYSKFLRLFSCLTTSPLALVLFQCLFLQGCVLYFLFSIKYLLKPGKWLFRLLIGLSIINPLPLFIGNLVSADALFASLSLIWFTQLLWILYRPNIQILILHALVLLLAFMMRYNALYYPFISLVVILFAQINRQSKVLAIGLIALFLIGFICATQVAYEKSTGKSLFIPAAGWQLAANALDAYEQLPLDSTAIAPFPFKKLQATIIRHIDSLNPIQKYIYHDLSYYYQYDKSSPLYTYMNRSFLKDSANSLKRWALMGTMYRAYGIYLIKQHPGAFFKYFILPNLAYFYTPQIELIGDYNMGKDSIDNLAVSWFGLKNTKVSQQKGFQTGITDYYPIIFALINAVFLLSFAGFSLLGGFTKSSQYVHRIFKLAMLLWLSNFCFSVLSSPVVLRYQLFNVVVAYTIGGILINLIIREARPTKIQDIT
jgi:hypothetical protein